MRLGDTKQAIVLIGNSTKHLYRFVRWEIQVCIQLDLPIVAVNLNGKRQIDYQLCPPILVDEFAIHVSFQMAIIKHALDYFPNQHANSRAANAAGPHHYSQETYALLGL